MNIDKALIKSAESKSLKEICQSPVSDLQGVSEGDAEHLKAAFNIKTIEDMANCKFFHWALSIKILADCEE